MTLNFIYRSCQERNDCVVQAIATASGLPYSEAHAIVARSGRKPKRRCNLVRAVEQFEKDTGICVASRDMAKPVCGRRSKNQTYPTLAAISPLLAAGRYIVKVGGHAFAVVDGIQYDWRPCGPRKRVMKIYQIAAAAPRAVENSVRG